MNHVRIDEEFSNALRAELVSRVDQAAPASARGRKPRRMWLAAGALAGAGLLGGMVAGGAGLFGFPASQQVSPQPSALASYRAEDTLAAFSGVTIDYDPFGSPEALAAVSQVIVQGTVNGVREGRTGTGFNSIVLIVEVQKVANGELPQGNDGNIYLELSAGGHPDPSYYTKAFPQGAAVVAYMRPAPDGLPREGIDVKIENPEAGRPAGQSLYLPTGPQGLALQVGDEDVVWPLIGARAPGDISDTLPGGGLIAQ